MFDQIFRRSSARSQATVERLVDEQAALRRVATLVAHGVAPGEILTAVAEEVARLFDLPWVGVMRYDTDDFFTVMATWGDHPFPAGSRWPLDGPSTFESVLRTGRPARLEDYTGLSGTVAEAARGAGITGGIGAPIVVEGTTWGVVAAPKTAARAIPAGAEIRLNQFTELVATAIANAESRELLARLADEQAALRRVATLVAQQPSPDEVFTAVTEAVGPLLGADLAAMHMFTGDGTAIAVAGWSAEGPMLPRGTRLPLDGDSAVARIFQTGAAARIDTYDDIEGQTADVARSLGLRSTVGAPIVVEGRLWGALMAATRGDEPLPLEAEPRIAALTELVATAVSNAESRAAEARLAEEQAALRRVAVLVARESSPVELFRVVTEEASRVLETEAVGMLRIDSDGAATLVAQSDTPWEPPPLGTRFTLEGENVIAQVVRTGQAARADDWTHATGSVAAMASVLGVRSSVATPIVVEGQLWGILIAATSQSEPLPGDIEPRIEQFTELVATAIANAQARGELSRLVEEQAALRRVATLVASDVEPGPLFDAVAGELEALFGADISAVVRFEGDGTVTVMGAHGGPHISGARVQLDPDYVVAAVYRTRQAARFDVDDWKGGTPAVVRDWGVRSALATPVVVEGELWGAITIASLDGVLAVATDRRLADFTALFATAIANTHAREQVAELADEQAALRRVATLVAEGVPPSEVFFAVSREVARVFASLVNITATVVRFDTGPECVLVGASKAVAETPIGTRWQPNDLYVSTRVLRTGVSARVDEADLAVGGFAAEQMRRQGYLSQVASPIMVEGRLWGAMTVSAVDALPPQTEERLQKFTELVETAIANAESREALGRLAGEQAALRRVATLVAQGVPSLELFSAVTKEVAHVFSAVEPSVLASVIRFDPGPECVLVGASRPYELEPVGSRWAPKDLYVSTRVLRTGGAARVSEADLEAVGGPDADVLRLRGFLHQVGSPVVVGGRLWGAMTLNSQKLLPPDVDQRLASFTGLVATAIANAASQSELAASRSRIVAAADDARRRIERDLHDGIQQQLVSLGMELGELEASLPADGELRPQLAAVTSGLRSAIDDLREISRGIHPAILSHGGLGPALKTLARRSPVPVQLNAAIDGRLSGHVEVAAYYVVSEALTNVARHAHAGVVSIDVLETSGTLELSIRDDGVGGAEPGVGSGLIGLKDRVEALGGRINVESPPGRGTSLVVVFPLGGEGSARGT